LSKRKLQLVETIFFPLSDKLQLLVLRRLSRIKLIEVPRRTKIKAVRMMGISLFSWSGAWQSLTKKFWDNGALPSKKLL
jgi:hypothetical protein